MASVCVKDSAAVAKKRLLPANRLSEAITVLMQAMINPQPIAVFAENGFRVQ